MNKLYIGLAVVGTILFVSGFVNSQTTSTATTKITTSTVEVTNKNGVIKKASVKKSIKKLLLNGDRVLRLEGVVGGNVIELANDLRNLDKASKRPIYLIIDSPGGSVINGAMLISAIEAAESPVYTICHRLCASMGAMILEYGDKRYAYDNSIIMFHQASAGVKGELGKMKAMTEFLERYITPFEINVANRMGISLSRYRARMYNEYWMSAHTALKHGAIDSLVDVNIKGESILNLRNKFDDKKTIPNKLNFGYDKERTKAIEDLQWISSTLR